MRLPHANDAHVPKEKLTGYLLRPDHTDAAGKAAFFLACGFQLEEWTAFAERLCEHVVRHPVATDPAADAYGNVYTVEGSLRTPSGETDRPVRSVWVIEYGKDFPRLVTAYLIDR